MDNITALKNLPTEIRSWLVSATTASAIGGINEKLGIQDDAARFIPFLVFQLVVAKSIEPRQFINELSAWLNITPKSAAIVAKEIEEKILEPIRGPLFSWGVDINLIQLGEMEMPSAPIKTVTIPESAPAIKAPTPSPTTPIAPTPVAPSLPKPAYIPPPQPTPGKPIEAPAAAGGYGVRPSGQAKKIVVIGEAHEHAEEIKKQDHGTSIKEQGMPEGLPSDLSFGALAKEEASAKEGPLIIHKETALQPVGVQGNIRMPPMPPRSSNQQPTTNTLQQKEGVPRVVHYSEKTSSAPQPPSDAPKPPEPKLKGNTVDLR